MLRIVINITLLNSLIFDAWVHRSIEIYNIYKKTTH